MKRALLAVAVILIAVPCFAADRFFDFTAAAVWVDPNSSGTFNSSNPNQPFDISFNGDLGYGIAANIFLGDTMSIEFAGSEVKPQANLRLRATGLTSAGQNVKMIPLTAVLQWHIFPKGRIDPYIGAGVAYVLFDQLQNPSDVGNIGFSKIDFKDDAGLALNAGLGIGLTQSIAITIDGKYVPLKSSATAVYNTGTTTADVKINPVIFSAGVTFRF